MNAFELLMRGICPKCNGSVLFSHYAGKRLCTQCGAYWSYDLVATDGDKMQVVVREWKAREHKEPKWHMPNGNSSVITYEVDN